MRNFNLPDDYLYNPGLYLGSKIDHLDFQLTDGEDVFGVVTFPEKCAPKFPKPIIERGSVISANSDDWFFENETGKSLQEYVLLRSVSTDLCEKLAPSIGGKCLEAYFLYILETPGRGEFAIYGLFELPEYGLTLAPLKYFTDSHHGHRYLDS